MFIINGLLWPDLAKLTATRFLTILPTPLPGYIGPNGGVFYSDDKNLEVYLPPGYLPNGASLTAYPIPESPNVQGYKVIGFSYCFGVWVDGKVADHFSQPIIISRRNYPRGSLTETQEKALRLAFYDESKSAWAELPSEVDRDANKIIVRTDSLLVGHVCSPENPQVLIAVVLRMEAAVTPTNTAVATKTAKPTEATTPTAPTTHLYLPLVVSNWRQPWLAPTPTMPIQPTPEPSFPCTSVLLSGVLLLLCLLLDGGVYTLTKRNGK